MRRLFTEVPCVLCLLAATSNSSSAGFLDLSAASTNADSVFVLEGYDFSAPNAFDGSLTTRWASAASGYVEHWIEVDLGANYTLSAVNIAWDASNAVSYEIGVRTAAQGFSSTFSEYTVIASVANHTQYTSTHQEYDDFFDFSSGTASFVAGTTATVTGEATSPVGQYLMIYRPGGYTSTVASINEIQVGGTVPEPSTLVLLGAGAISLLAYGWRKRREV
jgi:hypothetical protein